MKRKQLAQTLARATHQSEAEARDQLDELARRILAQLRAGREVRLPGLGRLVPTKSPGGRP